jgi:flagellar FliJ protein
VKRFRFRFQRVLETKRYVEEMKRNELAALVAQRLEDERRLLAVQADLLDQQLDLARRAEAGGKLSDVLLYARYFLKVADDIRRFEGQLAGWDEQIALKRAELVEARRETRVLEKVEESDRRAYGQAVARWEQKLMDEVAAGRYVRGVHEEIGQ